MRKIHYAWTPDITTSPFTAWTVVADTMDDGGTLTLGDSWLAADGRVHVVWQQDPIHPRLRDTYFRDIKRDWRLWYGVLKQGKLLEKRVLFSGGETTGPLQPTGRPRFHVTPDQTLYILYNLTGTTPATKEQTGSYAVRVEADDAHLQCSADSAATSADGHVLHRHAPFGKSTRRRRRPSPGRHHGR